MSDSPQLSASLLRLKLLDALRNGDINKIDTIVDELTSCKPTLQTQEIVQLKETILHYAVQVASLAITFSSIVFPVRCGEVFVTVAYDQ